MVIETQFSSMAERWSEISEFPEYSVSDQGRVWSSKTETIIMPTPKNTGMLMVGLMRNKVQQKRSLALLVAKAFLPPPPEETYDTVIHRDGNRGNNHCTNLIWRPLWFARRYMAQFNDGHPTIEDVIEDVESGITYDNSMTAAMTHGLLDLEIYISMQNNTYVWPTGQIFRRAVNR